jgi:hypothetical protein
VPSVITVAQTDGGIRDNIIPPDVRLSGIVRLFPRTAQDEVERHMREISIRPEKSRTIRQIDLSTSGLNKPFGRSVPRHRAAAWFATSQSLTGALY